MTLHHRHATHHHNRTPLTLLKGKHEELELDSTYLPSPELEIETGIDGSLCAKLIETSLSLDAILMIEIKACI